VLKRSCLNAQGGNVKIIQAGLQAVRTDDFLWGLLTTAEEFRTAGRSFDECYAALSTVVALTLTGKPTAKTQKLVKFMRKNHALIDDVIGAVHDLGLRRLAREQGWAECAAAGQRYVN
jgi:hypothetical protein